MNITINKPLTVLNSNGSVAGTLKPGVYHAEESKEQGPGWYAFRELDAQGNPVDGIIMNVHILGSIGT